LNFALLLKDDDLRLVAITPYEMERGLEDLHSGTVFGGYKLWFLGGTERVLFSLNGEEIPNEDKVKELVSQMLILGGNWNILCQEKWLSWFVKWIKDKTAEKTLLFRDIIISPHELRAV